MPTLSVQKRNTAICRGYVEWLRAHGRAPVTVYQYGAKCEELVTYLGDTPLADATLHQLEGWVARPRVGKGRGQLGADATRNKDVIVLRGLYKWACSHGFVLANPTLDMELPRVRNENPKAIEPEVWHTFWTSPLLEDTERVVFGLGFFCGLRREEICRIRVDHFDWDAGVVKGFKRKGDRGKASGVLPFVSCARLFAQEHPRLLGSPDEFLKPLEALCVSRAASMEALCVYGHSVPGGTRTPDRQDALRAVTENVAESLLSTTENVPWLVPWGLEAASNPLSFRLPGGSNGLMQGVARPIPDGMTSPDQINGRLLRALKRVGLPERAFSPHALRHSFVTYLLKGGAPLEVVSKLANHSSLDITLRYTKIADDPLAELLNQDTPLRGTRW